MENNDLILEKILQELCKLNDILVDVKEELGNIKRRM